MKPSHKKVKTKDKSKSIYKANLSQPDEQKKKIISKIKKSSNIINSTIYNKEPIIKQQPKTPNHLNDNNNFLFHNIKILNKRKHNGNCHKKEGNKCECHKPLNSFRNINKEFYNNLKSNIKNEGSTLVSSNSTILNRKVPNIERIKHLEKMGKSYFINSNDINDKSEPINNYNNNGYLSHTLRHSNSAGQIINLDYVSRSNYNNRIILNDNSNKINNYDVNNAEQNDIVNQQYKEEQNHPILNNTKCILKKSSSCNDVNNDSNQNTPTRNKEIQSESRNTFSFNPNNHENNYINNNIHHPLTPFNNEENINNNTIPQQTNSYQHQRTPSPHSKFDISGKISPIKSSSSRLHTRNLKSRSKSPSVSTSHNLNQFKDKLDIDAFEKDFQNIQLNSMRSKLKSFLKGTKNYYNIENKPFYSNKENINYVNYKGNNLLSNLLSKIQFHETNNLNMKSNCSLSKIYTINKKLYNNINLNKLCGININLSNLTNTKENLFSKYISKSSVMPANEYSSVISAREFVFMNN